MGCVFEAAGEVLALLLGDGRQRRQRRRLARGAVAEREDAPAVAGHAKVLVDHQAAAPLVLRQTQPLNELDGRQAGRPDHHPER